MKTSRDGWTWLIAMVATGAVLAVLGLAGLAHAAKPDERRGEGAPHAQSAPTERHEFRPGPEPRHWGRDRDERHGRMERDWDDRFARGYWSAPGLPEPWYPPAVQPAPMYVPGQWVWNGYGWVWQPGSWTN
jgi:hypothetical protein